MHQDIYGKSNLVLANTALVRFSGCSLGLDLAIIELF